MQISIHPKAKKILITLGAIALLGIAFFTVLPLLHSSSPTTATGTSPDAQAAVKALTAFYTLDYIESPELWATRVCTLATDSGCRAIHAFYATAVQVMVQENQIQTGCTVAPVRMVSDMGSIRIWHVNVTITKPWPGLGNPVQDVFVEVEDVNGIWLMNRILFQQEVGDFLTPIP
jgi:hypothetical protein